MNPSNNKKINTDRRTKPRINCDIYAIVNGWDKEGTVFEECAKVINLSANGIYFLLSHPVETGEKLSVRIALPFGSQDFDKPKLVTKGIVLRKEPQSIGLNGIAMKLENHTFIQNA